MLITSTVGSASANSYISIAEADAYFATSYNRPSWVGATVANKEIVLIESTRLLDFLVIWRGYKKTQEQSLNWPRTHVVDGDAPSTSNYQLYDSISSSYSYFDDSKIPTEVKQATCELGYSLLSSGGFQSEENDLTSVKVGPISVDFSASISTNGLPQIVRDMVSKWGSYTSQSSNSMFTAQLVRT